MGWRPTTGQAIAPGTGERESWDDLFIPSRLRAALRAHNPGVPREHLDQALAMIAAPTSQDAITENFRTHRRPAPSSASVSAVRADDDGATALDRAQPAPA